MVAENSSVRVSKASCEAVSMWQELTSGESHTNTGQAGQGGISFGEAVHCLQVVRRSRFNSHALSSSNPQQGTEWRREELGYRDTQAKTDEDVRPGSPHYMNANSLTQETELLRNFIGGHRTIDLLAIQFEELWCIWKTYTVSYNKHVNFVNKHN